MEGAGPLDGIIQRSGLDWRVKKEAAEENELRPSIAQDRRQGWTPHGHVKGSRSNGGGRRFKKPLISAKGDRNRVRELG